MTRHEAIAEDLADKLSLPPMVRKMLPGLLDQLAGLGYRVLRPTERVSDEPLPPTPDLKDNDFLCSHCDAMNPVYFLRATEAGIPNMGQVLLLTISCGSCRKFLSVQIVPMVPRIAPGMMPNGDPSRLRI